MHNEWQNALAILLNQDWTSLGAFAHSKRTQNRLERQQEKR